MSRRNAPCGCGTGRKFKKCCGVPKPPPPAPPPRDTPETKAVDALNFLGTLGIVAALGGKSRFSSKGTLTFRNSAARPTMEPQ